MSADARDDLPWPAFDDEVVRAMAKWPNVPEAYGWLSLDRRGEWRIQGEVIRHPRARDFISRHYRADARGRWFVQNGPQRVFVELDYTPWIYRLLPDERFSTHTGLTSSEVSSVAQDDDGNLLVVTALGVGLLDDRDLAAIETLLELDDEGAPRALRWHGHRLPLGTIARDTVPRVYAFEPRPAA